MTIRDVTIAAAVAAALGVAGGALAQTGQAPPPAAAPSRGDATTTPRTPGTMPGANTTVPDATPRNTVPAPTTGATSRNTATESGGRLTPGANSFTEGQARDRIGDAGFTDVQGLRLDEQGIWRGRAMRNGQQTGVALDYQGNVAATQ